MEGVHRAGGVQEPGERTDEEVGAALQLRVLVRGMSPWVCAGEERADLRTASDRDHNVKKNAE